METPGNVLYRAKEFASRAGVTVRTLHFYDSFGLLSPTARSDAGYRLYSDTDLERLEQILALRFVGLELELIKKLLDGPAQPLAVALHAQREIMLHEKRNLQRAIDAIDDAQKALERADDGARLKAVQNLIEAFKMKNDHSWTETYYSPEALDKLAEIRKTTSQETIEKGQRDWAELIAEVELAAERGEDAGSDLAQSLAQRWRDLVKQFTRGDASVHAGLNKLYNDPQHWPADFKRPWSDQADLFIKKAMNA
jgi:DNA-binding transcriptional MerR regulator